MSGDETRKILCSTCDVAAQAVINPNKDTRIRCHDCGAETDLKEAVAAAAKYQISNMLRASLGGIRGKHVKVKRSPNRTPQFVFE